MRYKVISRMGRVGELMPETIEGDFPIIDIEEKDIPEDISRGEYIFEDGIFKKVGHTGEYKNMLLRIRRQGECFTYINRGQLWYSNLTEEQQRELQQWYNAWLNVTETKIIPTKPTWLI